MQCYYWHLALFLEHIYASKDPISVGKENFQKRDSILVVCLQMISARTGRHSAPMAGGYTLGLGDHAGERLADITSDLWLHILGF